jgi:hypothetical protein
MFYVATLPQPSRFFILANSRHLRAKVVGQNEMLAYKGFWSCRQQKRLQPWRQLQRLSVAYLHSVGSALRCSVSERLVPNCRPHRPSAGQASDVA